MVLLALLLGIAMGVWLACFVRKCQRPFDAKCPKCDFKVASNDPKLTLLMMGDHTVRHGKAA